MGYESQVSCKVPSWGRVSVPFRLGLLSCWTAPNRWRGTWTFVGPSWPEPCGSTHPLLPGSPSHLSSTFNIQRTVTCLRNLQQGFLLLSSWKLLLLIQGFPPPFKSGMQLLRKATSPSHMRPLTFTWLVVIVQSVFSNNVLRFDLFCRRQRQGEPAPSALKQHCVCIRPKVYCWLIPERLQ